VVAPQHVVMRINGVEGTSTATREAFDTVWQPRGWVEVDPVAPVAAAALGHEVSNLGALNREELDAIATEAGLDSSGLSTKGEVVDLINSHLNKEQ